jgi:hypothetical protein
MYGPELMLWTAAVMMDSAQCLFELFVGTLSGRHRRHHASARSMNS